jgi:DNA-binding NarL/FixJ family response regulator
MSLISVVLVDDHQIVRQGLRSILDPDPRFTVLGEAASAAEAMQVVAEERPDVILLDLKLPDMGGVELCRRLVAESPESAVLILTALFDRNLISACLQAGARGYLLKDAEDLSLRDQLLAVVEGHSALDPRAADVLADLVRQSGPLPDPLSLRELEVLRLIAQGMTNREIGAELHLSENTVKGYVKDILSKLDARNRTEAVLFATEHNLI